jgi:hypothetical protein
MLWPTQVTGYEGRFKGRLSRGPRSSEISAKSWILGDSGIVEIGCGTISKRGFFMHHFAIPGNPVVRGLGVTMRKVALFAAVAVAAAFASTSPSYAVDADPLYSLNKNTHMFLKAAGNPYAATVKTAEPAKKGKKGKKKKS